MYPKKSILIEIFEFLNWTEIETAWLQCNHVHFSGNSGFIIRALYLQDVGDISSPLFRNKSRSRDETCDYVV